MSADAHELLCAAEALTETLLEAFDRGNATAEEILSTLEHRERLLRQINAGVAPSPSERAVGARLQALDTRLERALEHRRRAVVSQLVRARRRRAPQPKSPRLVHESA
jgi:hypothetical protein